MNESRIASIGLPAELEYLANDCAIGDEGGRMVSEGNRCGLGRLSGN